MELKFYNTLSRSLEEFKPVDSGCAKMYTCGPTVYNFAHIGNFRAYTFEDILRRVIQFNGMKIRQVMNLTDVDDKTIRGANAAGVALTDYTKTYKDAFFADLKKLNAVDVVIKEPKGGAQNDHRAACENVKKAVLAALKELKKLDIDELVARRYEKLRAMGDFS